jgi:ABC-type multidrug transport system fused ATPase/permease subunit
MYKKVSDQNKIKLLFVKLILLLRISIIKKVKIKFLILFLLSLLNIFFDLLSLVAIFPLILLILDQNRLAKYIADYNFLFFLKEYETGNLIILFSIVAIFFAILKIFIVGYFQFYKNKFFTKIQLGISSYLFNMYLSNPYFEILNKTKGQIVTNIKNEAERIGFAFKNIIDFILEFFILIMIGISILIVNFYIGIILIIFLLTISILFSHISKRYNSGIGQLRSRYMSLLVRYILETLEGIKIIKITNTKEKIIALYNKYDQDIIAQDIKFNTFQSFPRLFFEFILTLSILVLIIFMSFNDNKQILIPTLVFVGILGFRVLPAFSRIHNYLQAIRFTTNSVDNIYHEIILSKKKKKNKNLFKFSKFNNKLLLSAENIYFSFRENNKNEYLLQNINFKINKGEKIGIIGITGSGKSTFLDIILGFIKPLQGKLILNSLLQSKHESLNKFYSFVPQQPFLINESIYENIIFGNIVNKNQQIELINKRLKFALDVSCCQNFIKDLREGANTKVGENGAKLSLGQRQRLNLARALYSDAKLLVMDEPTSALDPRTEALIINKLLKLNNLSMIVVTHKHNILKKFDKIYELKNKTLTRIR